MFKIGITGSIGTGKTTIASVFASLKVPIFNADKEIKIILNNDRIKKKIKTIWPLAIENNCINKIKLRTIIFSNKIEKKKLEELLYPYLKIEFRKFEEKNKRKKILVYDVPLIYETNSEKEYDLIILANCDFETQRKRVISRDKISNSLFKQILKSQLSFDEKIKFKPIVINTDNTKLLLYIKVYLLIIGILIRLKIQNGTKKKVNT